jgi:putative DNA primase/helicase
MYNDSTPNDGQNSSTPKNHSFDIRDHLDKLQPGKGKNYYTCPVCGGQSLGVKPKNGEYQCWSGGCSLKDIKEAIRPLAEFLAERQAEREQQEQQPAPPPKKPKTKKKEYPPVPIPIGAKLLKLPAPGQSPQPEPLAKDTPKEIPRNALQTTYDYSSTQKVIRYEWPDATNPKGHDKTYRQFHLDPDGKKVWKKGEVRWPAYRIDEVVEILKTVPDGEPIAIAMLEGEPNVELARSIRLTALTLQGSNWGDVEIQKMLEALRATGKNVCLVAIRDNDDTGIKKGKGIELVARHIQFPCVVIDPRAIYSDIPEKGDIREILEVMEADEFLIRVEAEIFKVANSSESNNPVTSPPRTCEDVVSLSSISSGDDYIPDTAPAGEQTFIHKAIEALYSGEHWKSIGGVLYQFNGIYYEMRHEATEKKRILEWLKTYAEMVKGTYRCNRYNSASVNDVWNCMVASVAIDPNTINPEGLNTSTGVVKINPDGSHSLIPHDPEQVYTYVGCKYDATIDPADCDRLLECLEPPQRKIFLRTAAAALNLKLVRSKLTGRGVKGLLCHGEGSNGKDTLRAVLAAVFGRGMTAKSLSDFKSYDTGRKFNLSGLVGGICNWASENTSKVDLDNIQSLKQFITGDPIDIEPKGKDSYEYKPTATFFANCNKLPSITGGTAAIDDRYGVLRFNKTYARNAIAAEGQLEADARFKDDEKFILEQVAPAMLNKLLEEFPLLLSEGIDYTATKEAMQKAQEESRHLWQFAREVGLEAQSGGRVWITDLWDSLVNWYEGMGILDKELGNNSKEKLIWHELPNKYDAPVKSINQLSSRLSEIFPKIQVCKYLERDEMERRGQRYLLGVGFVQNSVETAKSSVPSVPVDTARDTSVPTSVPKNTGTDVGTNKTLIQSGGTDGTDDFTPFAEVCKLVSQFTDAERQKLIQLLTQPQPLPAQVTPAEFAGQIRKAISNVDQALANQILKVLKGKAKEKLREEVKSYLTGPENENFRLLVVAGFLLDMPVKYVGDPKYAEQYEGLELQVYSMDKYHQITCRKPDGYLTTRMKPEELEKL